MIGQSLWRLGVPLGVAVLATILLLLIAVSRTPVVPARYRVVAAAHALPVGTVLGPKDLTTLVLPVRPVAAVTSAAELLGKVTTVPLLAGELVTTTDVAAPNQEGLSYLLAHGERALTLGLTPVEAVGYALHPGDRVDAYVTVLAGTGVRGAPFSRTLVQDLLVLAVNPPAAGAGGGSVTLAVRPAEAALLLLGQAVGSVTLTLRAHGDGQRLPASAGVGGLAP